MKQESKSKSSKTLVIVLLLLAAAIIVLPLVMNKGAQFGGSDDAGTEMISEVTGTEHHAWFTPVIEKLIGGELPSEVETLLFCVQTGIGVGIIAFIMGRLVERKKWERKSGQEDEEEAES